MIALGRGEGMHLEGSKGLYWKIQIVITKKREWQTGINGSTEGIPLESPESTFGRADG